MEVAAAAPADSEKGRWDGEVAFDVLHASSNSAEPSSGPEPGLSSTELGVRIRGTVESGRVLGAVDYWGREPVAGTFRNSPYRLLYRAEVVGEVVEDHLSLAAGRFVAPSVVFLPVDGVRASWHTGDDLRVSAQLFGGRRGISTSRQDLGFDVMLPAVGGQVGLLGERGSADVMAAFAGDQASLGTGDSPTTREYDALSGTLRGRVEPIDDDLHVGGGLTMLQRASYVFLPNPGQATVTAQALDLFQANLYGRWRASDAVRVDVDAIHQDATLEFEGAAEDTSATVTIVDPTFDDVRLRPAFRAGKKAWIRPDARLRLRQARSELRYGLGADLADLGVAGPFVRARLWVEDIGGTDQPDDVGGVDRVLWSGSAGYAKGGFEAELGASRIDRAAAPVSGRSTAATASDDLAPFVLAAQDVGFLRTFLTNRAGSGQGSLFGGLDAELNLTDTPELRAFVQVGVLGVGGW